MASVRFQPFSFRLPSFSFHLLKRPNIVALITPVGPTVGESPAARDDNALFVFNDRPFFLLNGKSRLRIWPRSIGSDPAANVLGLLFRQPVILFRRHFQSVPDDRKIEGTLLRLSGNDCRIFRLAAPQQGLPRTDIEGTFDVFRIVAMTAETLRLQQWQDLEREQPLGRRCSIF